MELARLLAKALAFGVGIIVAKWLPVAVAVAVTVHVVAECLLASRRDESGRGVSMIVIASSWLSLALGTSFGIMASYALAQWSRTIVGGLLTAACILVGMSLRFGGLWLLRGARLGIAAGIASSFLISVASIAWLIVYLPSLGPLAWQDVQEYRLVTHVDYAAVFALVGLSLLVLFGLAGGRMTLSRNVRAYRLRDSLLDIGYLSIAGFMAASGRVL